MSTAGPVCPQETSVLVTITGNKLITNCNARYERKKQEQRCGESPCAAVAGCELRSRKEPGKAQSRRREQRVHSPGRGREVTSLPPGTAGPLRLECSQRGKDGTGRSEEGRREPRLRDRESPQGASDPILSVVGTFGAQE